MADIELIIKIPEEEYKIIKAGKAPMTWVEHLIKNGTPLPKEYSIMLKCPNCGLDVHSDFKTCPRCGAKMKVGE